MPRMTDRYTAADNLTELVETGFMLRRRIGLVVGLVLVAALAAALMIKPNYIASSQVVVLPSDEYTFHPSVGSNSLANEALSLQNMLDSEVAIIKSPALARAVLREVGVKTLYPALARKPGLVHRVMQYVRDLVLTPPKMTGANDAIARAVPLFESHLQAIAGAENDVITISFGNPKAAVAQKVLATLETMYLQQRRAMFISHESHGVAAAVAAQRAALDRAETALATFESAHNVTQFETREAILLKQQGTMEEDLMGATSSVAQLTTSLAALQKERAQVPHSIALQQSNDIGQRTAALRTSLDALRTRLAAELSNYRADSPEAANLRQQIATETALLARSTANNAPSSVQTGQNPVYGQINLNLMQDTAALAAARTRVTQDRAGLRQIDAQLKSLDGLKTELGTLKRQRSLAASDYASAGKTLAARQLAEQVDAVKRASVRILSAPTLPLTPFPLRKLIMLVGVVVALVGATLVVLLGNFFRRGALLARVLEADMGIPLLGVIPELPAPLARRLALPERSS